MRIPSSRETITVAGELAVVIALLMLLRAGVSSTLRWIHTRLNTTRGLESNIPYETSIFECMQRPLEFLSLFTVGTAFTEVVSRPLAATGLLRHIRSIRELGIIIAATWFLVRWIDRIRARFEADKRFDKAQIDASARFGTVITFVVSLLISLDTIGINVQTVLAFGGIGGVAIGFAGREIISNFFGGFMIYVTRPFTVGEWIRCIEEQQLNGTVENIGWYLTRVRTWDKRPLYIPNSRFSTLIVENGSRMDNRRIVHTLHLRLEDVPVVPKIVSQMESFLNNHPALDPRQHRLAYVDSFDDYSVRIWFSCYTKSVFLFDFRRTQQEILLKIHEIIRACGAKLATRNTRDVRPGIDTDRYGPLGISTSTTPAQQDITISESPSDEKVQSNRADIFVEPIPTAKDPIPKHTVVENAPTQAAPRPLDIQSGNKPPDLPVAKPDVESHARRPSSTAAALAAAAAALAVAQQNASRNADRSADATPNLSTQDPPVSSDGSGPPPAATSDTMPGTGDSAVGLTPPSDGKAVVQMQITKAPRIVDRDPVIDAPPSRPVDEENPEP